MRQRCVGVRPSAADKDIDRGQFVFGPCVDRDVRFGEQRDASHPMRFAKMVQANLDQRDARRRCRIAQQLIDECRIIQPLVRRQIGDQVEAVKKGVRGHNQTRTS